MGIQQLIVLVHLMYFIVKCFIQFLHAVSLKAAFKGPFLQGESQNPRWSLSTHLLLSFRGLVIHTWICQRNKLTKMLYFYIKTEEYKNTGKVPSCYVQYISCCSLLFHTFIKHTKIFFRFHIVLVTLTDKSYICNTNASCSAGGVAKHLV